MFKIISERQFAVMQQLWDQEKALTAKELKEKTGLNINTVQDCLRKLMAKGHVGNCSIVYSGTVLARAYKAITKREEMVELICKKAEGINAAGYIAENIVNKINTVEELEKLIRMIEVKREELQNKK